MYHLRTRLPPRGAGTLRNSVGDEAFHAALEPGPLAVGAGHLLAPSAWHDSTCQYSGLRGAPCVLLRYATGAFR
jgi:hypothetical protein